MGLRETGLRMWIKSVVAWEVRGRGPERGELKRKPLPVEFPVTHR